MRPGFTLAEVAVAMMLLSITALGVAATALVAVRSFTRAELQERTLREAEQVLDSLVLLPANSAGARVVGPARVDWLASDTSGSVIVRIAGPDRNTLTLTGQK